MTETHSVLRIDEKLADTVRKKWKGRELPFPILLDASGDTIKKWGIRAFPTVVLIHPQGKLIKGRAEQKLRSELEALRDKAIDGG